ncbi:MAG: hypothetical protein WD795_05205 [Woeseia sp.]
MAIILIGIIAMSTQKRAVDAPEVDNTNRRTFTEIRAAEIARLHDGGMTHFYNGQSDYAVRWLLSAAMQAADDRRIAAAINALEHAISDDGDEDTLKADDVVALEDLLDRAKVLVDAS